MSTTFKNNIQFQDNETWISKVNEVNLRLANLWKSDLNLSKHFNILQLCFQCSRSKFKFFVSIFKLHNRASAFEHISHEHRKSAFLLQISFFEWVSIFLLSYQYAQDTQHVNEKARILVDHQRKFKSNTSVCRGVLTILSNICDKSFGKWLTVFSVIIIFVTRTMGYTP